MINIVCPPKRMHIIRADRDHNYCFVVSGYISSWPSSCLTLLDLLLIPSPLLSLVALMTVVLLAASAVGIFSQRVDKSVQVLPRSCLELGRTRWRFHSFGYHRATSQSSSATSSMSEEASNLQLTVAFTAQQLQCDTDMNEGDAIVNCNYMVIRLSPLSKHAVTDALNNLLIHRKIIMKISQWFN